MFQKTPKKKVSKKGYSIHFCFSEISMQDKQAAEAEEAKALHDFWSKQPVIKEDQEDVLQGYIDPEIPVTAPPDKPAPLPAGFTWTNLDVNDDAQLQEIYNFLQMHYVEDSQHRFRFRLPAPLLRWALAIPGGIPEWIFGVRAKTGALVGFISGIPQTIRLNDDIQKWCAVNFLCVHTRLRSKKLAPVLIWELARRVRVAGVYRAVFSGAGIPSKHFCSVPYAHRPLELKKLSGCGFYPIPKEKMTTCQKRFAIPKLSHQNCRPMTEEDVPAVTELLNNSDSQYTFTLQFTEDLVRHMFLPKKDVVYSYVIPGTSSLKGFFSFYMMEWTILEENHMSLTYLRPAYCWYLAGIIDAKNLYGDLINKAANDAKADVVNGLLSGGFAEAMIQNKFEKGNRSLEYYSYNYAVPSMDESKIRFFFI